MTGSQKFRAGVLTMSDKGSRGERVDESGDLAFQILENQGLIMVKKGIVPDNIEEIRATLIDWCDNEGLSLIDYGIPGRIIHTPGHTLGSVSVLLDTGDAFVGCMAHNNPPFRLKPGLPIFAENLSMLKKSWRKLLDMGARTIYPGHGNSFSSREILKFVT